MPTAQQYRTKATEYAGFAETADSASRRREFRRLERNCISLAANEEWLAGHDDRTAGPPWPPDQAQADEEQILACLGAAVIMRWNTLPRKIQRELFAYAGSIGELRPTTELRAKIARFLHHHKDGVQKPATRPA